MIPAYFVLGLFARSAAAALILECGRPNGSGTLSGVARMAIDRGAAFHRRRIHGTFTVSIVAAGRVFCASLPTPFSHLPKVDSKPPAYTQAGTVPRAGFTHRFVPFLHKKHKNKNQEVPAILSLKPAS